MAPNIPALLLSAAAFAALAPATAGPAQPLVMRTVTMGGITAPAYYSVTERGYRFVGGISAEGSQMAALAASGV